MAHLDLNEPIDWDVLDDFDGETRELAGDFFFEVESDEDEDSNDDRTRQMMFDLNSSAAGGNGRGRRTLGLTGLRSARRWNAEESGSGGQDQRRGPLYVGESSRARALRGAQFAGDSSGNGDGRGGVHDEPELVPFPLSDGVFMFTSPSIAARGRGAAGRGAAGRGARGRGGAGHGAAGGGAGRGGRGRGGSVGSGGRGRGGSAGRGGRGGSAGRGGRGTAADGGHDHDADADQQGAYGAG